MDRSVDRRPRRWPLWLAGFTAIAVLAMVLAQPAVSRWSQADHTIDRTQLRFADAIRGDLVHDIAVSGRIVAASRPTLFSPSNGIVSVRARPGQTVSAGQVLAVVESPELTNRRAQEMSSLDALSSEVSRRRLSIRNTALNNRQAIDLLQVRTAAAQRAVKRNERMRDLGLVNDLDFEAAEDELEVANLELVHARQTARLEADMLAFEQSDAELRRDRQQLILDDIERQIAELQIRAPFDGLVATVPVQDRDAVTTGQALVGVVDLEALEVEIGIPEAYADDAEPGVTAVITIEGRPYPGELLQVAPEVINGVVTGRLKLTGERPAGLRQNQRVSTRLVLDRKSDVVKVPRGPFLESGGGRVLYVVADELARRRVVQLGVISVTEIEVQSGLEQGETIVLSDLGRFDGAETILLRN